LALGAPAPAEFTRTRADLESFRRGDRQSFERIWDRYRPAIEILVAGRIRSGLEFALRPRLDAEAEDVFQEVAATVFEKLSNFEYRGAGSLLAWIRRIVELAVLERANYWRAGKRHPAAEQRPAPIGAETRPGGASAVPDSRPGPATTFEEAEGRRRVAAALATLSERHHTILFFRFFGGAEWAEIAAEVGAASPDAVRMECHLHALPALAAALARA
jgi:RNA polymerase sigma factor (sigma-70 family)